MRKVGRGTHIIEDKVKSALKFSPCELSEESFSMVVDHIKTVVVEFEPKRDRPGRVIVTSGEGYTEILDAIHKEADLTTLKIEDLQRLSDVQLSSMIRVTAEGDGVSVPTASEMKQIITSINRERDKDINAIEHIKSKLESGPSTRLRGDII